jgi:5-formyltetrahydrofolate cyclo-ligase
MLSRRRALGAVDVAAWSRAIQATALGLSAYRTAHSVAIYSPLQNEVGTEPMLEHALACGKVVFYPKTAQNDTPELIRVNSAAELCPGRFGIAEPSGAEPLAAANSASLIVFVPGVAFDLLGNRLGWGQGCYDRILSVLPSSATFVALAYEFQIVPVLPIEAWDRRVHYIVTERRTIDCARTPAQSLQIS